MFITKLKLTNFRNILEADLVFTKNLNIFYGENAQGKTSLVEAIGLLATMKSFREEDDKILINSECDFAKVAAEFMNNHIRHQVEVIIDRKDKKVHFDGEKNIPSSDFVGSVNVVTFAPDDVGLFKDAPKARRDFLDDELGKISPAYHYAKLKFNQLLKERNELLKQELIDDLMFTIISEQFSRINLEIVKKRFDFVAKLNRYLSDKYRHLSHDENSELEIEYKTFIEEDQCTYEEILQRILKNQNDDIKKQATQVGVHRDDFIVYLNNLDVAKFGSQGQMRLSAIALKLALIEVIKEKNEDDAMIVLDDVLSELDELRQRSLLTYLKRQNQVFLTTAHIVELKSHLHHYDCDYWLVRQGVITKENE